MTSFEGTKRQLTGETVLVHCACPRCKRNHSGYIPIEHAQGKFAWKSDSGRFMILCVSCRDANKRGFDIDRRIR